MNTKKLPLIAAGAENGITNLAGSNLPDLMWLSPPKRIALNDGEFHVWRFSLEASASKVRWFRRMLASEELDRAERFYFEKDYIHYIVGRGMLITILSHYLNIEPDKLIFRYGKYVPLKKWSLL